MFLKINNKDRSGGLDSVSSIQIGETRQSVVASDPEHSFSLSINSHEVKPKGSVAISCFIEDRPANQFVAYSNQIPLKWDSIAGMELGIEPNL